MGYLKRWFFGPLKLWESVNSGFLSFPDHFTNSDHFLLQQSFLHIAYNCYLYTTILVPLYVL